MKHYNMNEECEAVFIPKGYYLYEEGNPILQPVEKDGFCSFDLIKTIALDKHGNEASEKVSINQRPYHISYYVEKEVIYTHHLLKEELSDWLDYHFAQAVDKNRFLKYIEELYKKMINIPTTPRQDESGTRIKNLANDKIVEEWLKTKLIELNQQKSKSTNKTQLTNFVSRSPNQQDTRTQLNHLLQPLIGKDAKDISILSEENFVKLVDALVNIVDIGIPQDMNKDVFRYKGKPNVFYAHIANALVTMEIPITEKKVGDALFKLRINFKTSTANHLSAGTITTNLKRAAIKIRRKLDESEL
jgi:hypothetical protein